MGVEKKHNQRRQKRAISAPRPGKGKMPPSEGKRGRPRKRTAEQVEIEQSTRYTRNELFELYTYFADDPDALEKLSGFMGVDKNNTAAVELLAEFAAVLDAKQLGMEQRGREREGRYHV